MKNKINKKFKIIYAFRIIKIKMRYFLNNTKNSKIKFKMKII